MTEGRKCRAGTLLILFLVLLACAAGGHYAQEYKSWLFREQTEVSTDAAGREVLKLLQDQSREQGMTVVIITHNSALTAMADRVIKVRSGTIQSVKENEHVIPVEEIEW